mgnify:FL=1
MNRIWRFGINIWGFLDKFAAKNRFSSCCQTGIIFRHGFSKFETDSVTLRSHTHDTGNVNSQYPVDQVLPILCPRQGSTQSPVHSSSVAGPGQPHPTNPSVLGFYVWSDPLLWITCFIMHISTTGLIWLLKTYLVFIYHPQFTKRVAFFQIADNRLHLFFLQFGGLNHEGGVFHKLFGFYDTFLNELPNTVWI